MVKDEADVVFLNLLWHYSLGFRRFVMIDNASTDNTREEIERFAKTFGDAVVVVILDPIIAHLQSEFTTSALRTVCTIWPEVEWVFPVDADEFLCVEKSLGTILSEIPEKAGAIISPKAQYIPTSDYFSLDSQWQFFRRLTHRSAISHNSSKVAVRAYPQYEIQQGNHGVTVGGLGIQSYIGGLSLGLHYREYFLRSLQHTQSKVLNGGRAIEAAEALGKRDVGGDHWKAWYGIVKEQGEGAIKAIFESHFRDPETLIHDPAPIQMVIEQLL
jgi:glycosyltransferase involved in cell wall biosynthesis